VKVSIKQIIAQIVVTFVIFAIALFLPAGTVAWSADWIFLGMFFVWFIAVNIWLFKHNPGLLQERMKLGRSDQKRPYCLDPGMAFSWG
jgi:hypothetical protein